MVIKNINIDMSNNNSSVKNVGDQSRVTLKIESVNNVYNFYNMPADLGASKPVKLKIPPQEEPLEDW